jgi:putative flippase GtrA
LETRLIDRHRALSHPELNRVVKFALVGLSNTIITLGVYGGLVHLGANYMVAAVIGWSVGALNGYTWNRIWTFRVGAHQHELLGKYLGVALTGLILNTVLLRIAIEELGFEELGGQAVVLPIVAATTFLINRFWTFGEEMRASAERTNPHDSPPGAPSPRARP